MTTSQDWMPGLEDDPEEPEGPVIGRLGFFFQAGSDTTPLAGPGRMPRGAVTL